VRKLQVLITKRGQVRMFMLCKIGKVLFFFLLKKILKGTTSNSMTHLNLEALIIEGGLGERNNGKSVGVIWC